GTSKEGGGSVHGLMDGLTAAFGGRPVDGVNQLIPVHSEDQLEVNWMGSNWKGSNRSVELPPNWYSIRRRVLRRDPACRVDGCSSPSTEVDHIRPGHDHSESNLRGICSFHHRRKSSMEGVNQRAKLRKLRRRPEQRHPGLTR